MPTQLPPNMIIGSILPRDDARDALVVHPSLSTRYKTLSSLPAESVIGTSSLRRMAQLKRLHPHLRFADCRGNVGTRLAKLDATDSQYAALILAAAGLRRLGMTERITAYLSSENGGLLHAVGQGAIGVEIRSEDQATKDLLAKVGDEPTTRACLAERSLMRTLEGGCSVPIGVETTWTKKKNVLGTNSGGGVGIGAKPAAEYDKLSGVAISSSEATGAQSSTRLSSSQSRDNSDVTKTRHSEEGGAEEAGEEEEEERSSELVMKAIVVSLDGQQVVETEMRRMISTREEADEFGWDVARRLVEGGADKILHEINLNRKILEEGGDA